VFAQHVLHTHRDGDRSDNQRARSIERRAGINDDTRRG
jgi:hypothetical protein